MKIHGHGLSPLLMQNSYSKFILAIKLHLLFDLTHQIHIFLRGSHLSIVSLISFLTAMDISADLTELSRTPVAVVSAGVKSILDIGRTLEYLVGVKSILDIGRTLDYLVIVKSILDIDRTLEYLVGVKSILDIERILEYLEGVKSIFNIERTLEYPVGVKSILDISYLVGVKYLINFKNINAQNRGQNNRRSREHLLKVYSCLDSN